MGVLPKLEQIDLVFSYTSFLRKLVRWGRTKVYQHKIKSIVVILGLYAAYKTFGVYKSLKSILNPMADLPQIEDEHGAAEASSSPSQEEL